MVPRVHSPSEGSLNEREEEEEEAIESMERVTQLAVGTNSDWHRPTEEDNNWYQGLIKGYIKEVSFEFRFKGVNRARLSDVSWEVIPEESSPIGKSPAASWLLLHPGNHQEPWILRVYCPSWNIWRNEIWHVHGFLTIEIWEITELSRLTFTLSTWCLCLAGAMTSISVLSEFRSRKFSDIHFFTT